AGASGPPAASTPAPRDAGPPSLVDRVAEVLEEGDDCRRRADQERRARGHDRSAPAQRRVVVVARVRAQRPRRGRDDEAGERGKKAPEREPVDELLEGRASGQSIRVWLAADA